MNESSAKVRDDREGERIFARSNPGKRTREPCQVSSRVRISRRTAVKMEGRKNGGNASFHVTVHKFSQTHLVSSKNVKLNLGKLQRRPTLQSLRRGNTSTYLDWRAATDTSTNWPSLQGGALG